MKSSPDYSQTCLRSQLESVGDERVAQAELEPVEKVPVLAGLGLLVEGSGDDLRERQAKGARDDVVDAEDAKGEREDVGGVESGGGEDDLPQGLASFPDAEVEVQALGDGGEDGAEAGLPRPGHRARHHRATPASHLGADPRHLPARERRALTHPLAALETQRPRGSRPAANSVSPGGPEGAAAQSDRRDRGGHLLSLCTF
mmetsp:Transcript_9751/g.44444  ORF Transcript_9751/g.44444 Transcript_9751/m.44444 type:complete len:201 (+) Transcript_9751:222-824(+)